MRQHLHRWLCAAAALVMLALLLPVPASATVTGTVSFIARDDQGSAVPGVSFTMFNAAAQSFTAVSSSNGTVTFAGLVPGQYAIFVTALPPGYTIPSGSVVVATVATNGQVSYDRNPSDGLRLQRGLGTATYVIRDVNGNAVEGAVFHVAGGSVQDNFTTDQNGILYLSLPMGSYTMTCAHVPPEWEVSTASLSFSVDPTGSYIHTRNPSDVFRLALAKFSLTFTKIDNAGEPVAGAVFRLTGTGLNTTATSNEAGVVSFTGLRARDPATPNSGEYVLTEVSAPSGYTRTEGDVQIVMQANGTYTASDDPATFFINQRGTHQLSFVHRDDAGTALAHAEFHLEGAAGSFDATSEAVTGRVLFPNLPFGSYRLTLTTPADGYAGISDTVDVLVNASGGVTYSRDPSAVFTAQRNRFGFTFTARDGNNAALSGAVYTLAGSGSPVTARSLTDGAVTFSDLLPGKYTLTQTSVPAGRTRSTQSVTVTVARDGTVTFSTPIETTIVATMAKFTVSFDKLDDTGAPVVGALFSLKGKDYTNESRASGTGRVLFSNLDPGEYTLAEVSAPEGYVLSTASVTVTVGDTGQVSYSKDPGTVFTNPRSSYSLSFVTVDEKGEGLQGARFVITGGNKLRAEASSNRRGSVTFGKLPHGSYTVEQLSAPAGYVKSPRKMSVEIAPDGSSTCYAMDLVAEGEEAAAPEALPTPDGYFVNTAGPVSFAFAAFDDEFRPLAMATFTLTESLTGGQVSVASSSTGYATFYGVMPGEYTLGQSVAPPPYRPSQEEYVLRIDAGGEMSAYTRHEGQETLVYKADMPQGETRVVPTIAFVSSREKVSLRVFVLDAETGEGILGAAFTLREEIESPGIATLITSAQGYAQSAPLLPGTYYLTAQTVPPGYEILTDGGVIRAMVSQSGEAYVEILAQPLAAEVVAPPSDLIGKAGNFLRDNVIALSLSGGGALLLAAFLVIALKR